MRIIPWACGLALQLWCSCSSACSSCSSPASAPGRRRNPALAGMVTRLVPMVGWAMMAMRPRRLRGGPGGIGGFDVGNGIV